MSETRPASTMRSLERAIDVLEVLEAARAPLRLSEIARRSDLHVATTQRILTVLEKRGRVEHAESGYTTGVAMLFGAHAYLSTNRIAQAATMVLQQLASSTRLTASVFVRAGSSRAVVARIEGDDPLRYVLPIGERLPLHLGAGKVLAAYMSPADLEAVFGTDPSFTRVDGTRLGRSGFLEELAAIRKTGWVFSKDERVIGAASVAAPVLATDGSCTAAVQVSGPSNNAAFEDPAALGTEVRLAATGLASRLN